MTTIMASTEDTRMTILRQADAQADQLQAPGSIARRPIGHGRPPLADRSPAPMDFDVVTDPVTA
ncbi:hypothetical protein WI697_06520 [Tistrella mobilis]|uniref:hypothetical protein n=1 Tax=Tistrella mobilis TaxID=171437 RepID=UPI0031F5F274